MSKSIYSLAIKSRRVSTFAYTIGLFIFGLMYAALFNDFASKINQFTDAYPSSFNAVFGDLASASTAAGWLNLEMFSLFLPIFVIIFGISFGASAIGKEEDSGTLELLLASPIKRSRILVEKVLAIFSVIFIVVAGTWVSIWLGTLLFNFDISLIDVLLGCISAGLLGLTYGMFSLAVQGVSGRRALALGLGSSAFALTYFAYVIAQLSDKLQFLKHISPYYYFDSAAVLTGNGKLINFVVLVGLSASFYIVAYIGFTNRDTGV